jgi:putative DNA primase/helicase
MNTENFRAAMRKAGLEYGGPIEADGRRHRIKVEGDSRANSWYVLHADPPMAGAFGCWKRGTKQTWCDREPGKMSQEQWTEVRRRWEEIERERERIETERHEKAAKAAARILARTTPVTAHEYLERKGVKAHGELRQRSDELVVPLRDANGNLQTLQFIAPNKRFGKDGEKRDKDFLRGGKIAGGLFTLCDKPDGPLVICEGFATGATIQEATGNAVVCAMNCGNIPAVAKAMRTKSPERDIIIAADSDQWTAGNPGLTKAAAAAKTIGAKLAVPKFKDNTSHPTDFNDLKQLEGLESVKTQIEAANRPECEKLKGGKDTRELLNDSLPKIQLPGDNHLLSQTAAEVGKILSSQNIFTRGGLVFTLDEKGDRLILMTPETLRTWIEDYVILYRVREGSGKNERIEFRRTISEADAKGILASPQFQRSLRPIEKLNPIRMPVMENGKLRLLQEGYDAGTRSFTLNPIKITEMEASEAKRIIEELFREFNFADRGRSKAVAVAGMMTVFGIGLLPRSALRPCFIYMANAEGAGKTLLVKCASVPILGYAPTGTRPNEEEEMRKTLHTAVMEARKVVFFDNVKKHLASEALEGFLTAQTYGGRILKESRSFQGENNAVVFISGNGCTVSPDMRRRSLFAELFVEAERAEDRVFKNDLEVPALIARRAEIVSALWELIQEWDHANRPKPSRGSSSFPEWANIIGGIIQHAGFDCALETPQIESAADTDGADMRALVKAIADGASLKQVAFDEITEVARSEGLFTRIITDDKALDAKGKATLAALLKRYDRRLIGGFRFTLLGKGRSRRFQVEEIRR